MQIELDAAEDFKHPDRLRAFVKGLRRTALCYRRFKYKIDPLLFEDEDLMSDHESNLLPEYYYCKYLIAHVLQPKSIVEIGIRAGLSAWTFTLASGAQEYTGYDTYEETAKFRPLAERRLKAYQSSKIVVADSQRLSGVPKADLYHVDGLHTRAGTYSDLCLCHDHAPDGAAILVDDVMCGPHVIAGVYDFMLDRKCFPIFFKDLRGEALFFKHAPHPSKVFMLQSTFPQQYIGV